MKSGVSLQQMLTEVKRQSESKEDYLIAPNRLRMESYGKEMFLHLSDDSGTELIEPMTITGIAHRQIGTHLRIPAAYYDRMREERPDLLAYNIAALILLDYLEENAENREKLIAANERAHVQDENIQALSQAYAGQRKMTHDFRANLSTLSELLESERVDDAKEFLSELNVRQSERILLVNSHNAAIDAVLNQKGYIGKKQGIDMRFRVNDLSALRLPRVDVTIVLGNLIDNALEACAGLSDPNRWVSIQILYSENMLSILIINPSNIVQINDGHIPTTKQDPLLHGFGIGNVKDILEKYHAEYLFTYDDGRFIFSADWPDIAEPSVNTSILS